MKSSEARELAQALLAFADAEDQAHKDYIAVRVFEGTDAERAAVEAKVKESMKKSKQAHGEVYRLLWRHRR